MRYWILAALLLSPSLWADTLAHYQDRRNAYVGGNISALNLDYRNGDLSPSGVGVRLGGMIDRHWGMEVRATVAPLKDTRRGSNGFKADYTVDHVGALLATGRYPFSLPFELPLLGALENRLVENYFVQGFAGVADAKVKTDRRFSCSSGACRQDTERNDETSLAWGVAVGVRSRHNLGLTLQYMHYISADPIDVTSIEGGLEWYF